MSKEQEVDELLTRGVAEVIDKDHLKKRLLSGEKLRVKLGIDPTSPNIHLGRAVSLLKLRDFQKLGCEIHFIVGDFTGQIGDTSDKESERPMLSEDLVKKNMETYLDQASKILNKGFKVHYNSKWLSKLTLRRIGELSTWFSLNEFISRENIRKRLDEGKRISLRELLYPLMQGYDSIMVDADVEIGGTDQRFNLLAGRESQRHMVSSIEEMKLIEENIGQPPKQRFGTSIGENPLAGEPQDILMNNLILGTDGRKMSSSWGNTINLTDEPEQMFVKVMTVPDDLIVEYFVHCTRVPMEEVNAIKDELTKESLHPRAAKMQLAREIVTMYHDGKKAKDAEHFFTEVYTEKKIPQYVEAYEARENIFDFMVSARLAESKSQARRLIENKGVKIDGVQIAVGEEILSKEKHNGKIMQVGKKFAKIVF